MTHSHPEVDWLIDYAAGSLADSHALCVAAHLEHCSACRSEVEKLASVGAALFNDPRSGHDVTESEIDCKIDDDLIELAMSGLNAEQQQAEREHTKSQPAAEKGLAAAISQSSKEQLLPAAFSTLAPGGLASLRWKKYGKNLSVAELGRIDEKREVALHRLEPGAAVAHHDHHGREITVVLTGSFSDHNGQYFPGDFIVRESGDQHRPTASDNASCICLSVTDAPVKFTGMLTRLLNPVMAYRHP